MHISDGILPVKVVASAGVGTAALAGALMVRLDADRVPRVALCTSFFFVASLVHVPLGPSSVHLMLIGLVGVIMGPWAFLPILFGLILQALLFQHGGVTTLGVNALVMGLPAYGAYGLFRLERRVKFSGSTLLFGFIAGSGAVIGAAVLLASFLALAGESFHGVAVMAAAAHVPVAVVEGVITGFAAVLLKRVEPRLLEAGYV